MSIRADVAGPIKQLSWLYNCLGCGAKYGTLFIQLTVSTVRFHWSMLFNFKCRMDFFKCGTSTNHIKSLTYAIYFFS